MTPTPAVGVQSRPFTTLQSLPSIANVVDQIRPWVASITVETQIRGFFTTFDEEGAGSGFVVRPDGYVVTNNHVIQGASEVQVHLPGGDTYDAAVVGRDDVRDIAVLKIDATGLPFAEFAPAGLRVGDWVMTMGNALDLMGGPTVTLGIVSGLGRTMQTEQYPNFFYDLIQTDAAINTGNSGGPLVDLQGKVVGINQATLRQAQGISFAISAATAEPIIQSLIDHGRVVRPSLGFRGIDVTPARASRFRLVVTEGVLVTRVSGEGPAYVGGVRVGDIITKIDGIPTQDMARLLSLLWSYKVGDNILVEYISEDQYLSTTIELAERSS